LTSPSKKTPSFKNHIGLAIGLSFVLFQLDHQSQNSLLFSSKILSPNLAPTAFLPTPTSIRVSFFKAIFLPCGGVDRDSFCFGHYSQYPQVGDPSPPIRCVIPPGPPADSCFPNSSILICSFFPPPSACCSQVTYPRRCTNPSLDYEFPSPCCFVSALVSTADGAQPCVTLSWDWPTFCCVPTRPVSARCPVLPIFPRHVPPFPF